MYAFPTFAAKFKLIVLDRKIRVGAVSYLNTKPLLYGIENSPVINEISLITEYPARIAEMLLLDEIDIGLVPVSIIPQMKEYHINTRYCIGSDGPVASVCLFSEVPVRGYKDSYIRLPEPYIRRACGDFIRETLETKAGVHTGRS